MPCGGEARHVCPQFGHNDFSRRSANARDGVQTHQCRLKRAQPLRNLGAPLGDAVVEEVDVGKVQCEQHAMVVVDLPGQGAR